MQRPFKLGLVINPYAGIGGALALKGSDGKETRDKALAMGAEKKANARVETALRLLMDYRGQIEILTAAGEMGADVASALGFATRVIYTPASTQTEASDTESTARLLLEQAVDLLLFAGGDGTARNICHVVEGHIPVLGVPAGCKIHSGVYAVTPKAAGRVVEQMVNGELLTLNQAEVMDIDEQAFRAGRVKARQFGEMQVPSELRYVQAVKSGGKESDDLVLQDIADYLIEQMEDELYVMGSGSTVAAVMAHMQLENTLLGVDLVQEQTLIGRDLTAQELLRQIKGKITKLVITLIGGQGHVFGRGNQQLSPAVIRAVGKDNIVLIATKSKLQALQGRPLLVDTGDPELDSQLGGYIPVITGYKDQVLYPINSPGEE